MSTWQQLGSVSPRALVDARLQLHWCVQLAAAPGKALAEPAPDYRHTALEWSAPLDALVGPSIPGDPPYRAGLRPSDMALFLNDGTGELIESLPLEGETVLGGLEWLTSAIERFRDVPPSLEEPRRDLPHHPVADGATITVDGPTAAELGRHLADTDCTLRAERGALAGASPVSFWPHHLDIAMLWVIDEDADPETARSINLGMALGDEIIAEPYWYVTPWPPPDPAQLPDLPMGEWNTDGWVGALLHSSDMPGQAEAQDRLLSEFIDGAVAASRQVLE